MMHRSMWYQWRWYRRRLLCVSVYLSLFHMIICAYNRILSEQSSTAVAQTSERAGFVHVHIHVADEHGVHDDVIFQATRALHAAVFVHADDVAGGG